MVAGLDHAFPVKKTPLPEALPGIARSWIRSSLLLFAISLGTLFLRLGDLPFLGADEPRYARIAEEMRASGSWVTPLLEGRPWLEKPPLYYWVTIPVISILGSGETGSRLAPALFAVVAAFAVLYLGRRVISPPAGFYAGIILLTSLGFAAFARSASPDILLAACLTVALSLLGACALLPDFPAWARLLAYAFVGLAILAKGPLALLLVVGIGTLFWWLDEPGGNARKWKPASGLVITAAVSLPWFWLAFREHTFSFVAVFFVNHNLARYVSDLHHHSQPVYYYLPVLLGLLFPWSGWLPLLPSGRLLQNPRNWLRLDSATLFLLCWCVFPLVFFSLSRSKLPGYILPSLPPLALLLGKRLVTLQGKPGYGTKLSFASWFYLALSALVAFALPITLHWNYGGGWKLGLIPALVILVPAVIAFFAERRGDMRRLVLATSFQGFFLVVSLALFAFPTLASYHSTQDIARQALSLRKEGEPIVTYRFFHHTLHYYTGYQIAADLSGAEELLDFALTHRSFLVVTEAIRIEDLRAVSGFFATPLAQQAKLRLIRLTHQ